MWCGCGAGDSSKGVKQRREECLTSRNTTNLTTGSGMQQARNLRAEETIGVVQNHEDGTRFAERDLREPKRAAMHAGVDARQGRYRGMQTKARGERHGRPGPKRQATRSGGEPRPEGPHDSRLRKEHRNGVTQSEDLGDARGNA